MRWEWINYSFFFLVICSFKRNHLRNGEASFIKPRPSFHRLQEWSTLVWFIMSVSSSTQIWDGFDLGFDLSSLTFHRVWYISVIYNTCSVFSQVEAGSVPVPDKFTEGQCEGKHLCLYELYSVGMTWQCVNDDKLVIYRCTVPLNVCSRVLCFALLEVLDLLCVFQLKAKRSDCNSKATHARNEYLLTLAAANAHHDRYYQTDLVSCIKVSTIISLF